jgi:hypothetical protein
MVIVELGATQLLKRKGKFSTTGEPVEKYREHKRGDCRSDGDVCVC